MGASDHGHLHRLLAGERASGSADVTIRTTVAMWAHAAAAAGLLGLVVLVQGAEPGAGLLPVAGSVTLLAVAGVVTRGFRHVDQGGLVWMAAGASGVWVVLDLLLWAVSVQLLVLAALGQLMLVLVLIGDDD